MRNSFKLKPQLFRCAAVCAAALALAMGVERAQARLTGVDVYEGNGTINWSTVHSAGISFAFTKATQGNYYEDPDMAANMNNGKADGIIMGVYDLADPEACSPSTEANYFWNYAKSYIKADGKTIMPVLDFEPQTLGESGPWNGASSSSDWINQWCNDVVSLASADGLDVTPIIYISAGWTSTWLTSANGWTGAWIADYNGYNSQTGSPWDGGSYYQPWGSGVWDFWQYTSSGSVSGISGAVDEDVLNGTSLASYEVTALNIWHGWDNPGNGVPTNGLTFTTAFASCSWTNNRIDIFGIGSDHQLYHTYWAGAGWQTPWQQLSPPSGVTPAGGPGASANLNQPWRLDDYIIGTDGNCYHQDWQSGWSAWQSLGHPTNTTLVGTPSATSWAPGRVDVYCKGADNAVYRKYWTASSGWVGWIAQGGSIIGDPSSVTWAANRLDAYVVGTDDQIWHQYWNGSSFVPGQTSWQEDLPETTTTSGVAVCSWGVNRLDMFVNTGSTIAHNWYNSGWNGNWNETHTPPVTPVGAPAASTWAVDRIDVIVLGSDGLCYHTYYGQ